MLTLLFLGWKAALTIPFLLLDFMICKDIYKFIKKKLTNNKKEPS